jgi:uncharacterized protein (TIGR03067 family)
MRKRFVASAAVAWICGIGMAADPPTSQPTASLPSPKLASLPKEMIGVWVPVSCQANGMEQFGERERKEFRLSIEDSQHKLYLLTDAAKMEGVRIHAAKMTVDEKAGTFELEVTDSRLKHKGDRIHGIYELSGDSLKLCYGSADKPRPTKFEAPKGSDVFCEVWTRHQKK